MNQWRMYYDTYEVKQCWYDIPQMTVLHKAHIPVIKWDDSCVIGDKDSRKEEYLDSDYQAPVIGEDKECIEPIND